MCGLVCLIGNFHDRDELLGKMLKKQSHRGPDYTGIWKDNKIGLGHNRLSIIDTSPSANQPMMSNCENYIIIFNGEIYNYLELKNLIKNYSLNTTSDTEVLLALYIKYKAKMLQYINGMFSFVIYDKLKNKIFGARDRFGVKPLYYTKLNGSIILTSEIKTLWEADINKIKNFKIWSNYILYGDYGTKNETFWSEIYQIKPGNYFEINCGQMIMVEKPYYNFVQRVELIKDDLSEKEKHLDEYLNLLEESIKYRFRSDVKVGVNLSGGLDSSVLISLINKLYNKKTDGIPVFTFYSDNKNYDEIFWVKKLLNHFNNPLHEILFDYKKIENLFEEVASYQDEPFGGFPTMAYSNIFKAAKSMGLKVLMDGQGIDEAWAGYDYYFKNTKDKIQGSSGVDVDLNVVDQEFKGHSSIEEFSKPFNNKLLDTQYRDIFYTKLPRALRFNDRISMMHSIELREPFLDYRLVEYAFSLPINFKKRGNQNKFLLREIAQNLFENNIANSPKRPLQTPQREWLGGQLKDWAESKIIKFSENDYVNKRMVMKNWNDYLSGNMTNSFHIWQYINLSYY